MKFLYPRRVKFVISVPLAKPARSNRARWYRQSKAVREGKKRRRREKWPTRGAEGRVKKGGVRPPRRITGERRSTLSWSVSNPSCSAPISPWSGVITPPPEPLLSASSASSTHRRETPLTLPSSVPSAPRLPPSSPPPPAPSLSTRIGVYLSRFLFWYIREIGCYPCCLLSSWAMICWLLFESFWCLFEYEAETCWSPLS